MKEEKEKGSGVPRKKPGRLVIIFLVLAIIFAILGIFDMTAYAAEDEMYVSSWWSKIYIDSNGEEQTVKNDWYTYSSSSPMEVFYYQSHDDYVSGEAVSFAIYVVSDSPILASGSTSSFNSTEYTLDDGSSIYVCMSSSGTTFAEPLSGYVEVTTDADNVTRFDSLYSRDDFVDYYSDTLRSSTHIVTTRIIQHYFEDNGSTYIDGYPRETVFATVTSDSPIYAFLCQDIYGMNTQSVTLWSYIISASPLCVNGEAVNQYTFEKDGQTYYICTGGYFSTGGDSPHYLEQFADGADYVYQCGSAYSADSDGRNALISDFQNSSIQGDIQIDYDSLEIDNDLPVPTDIKINSIENKTSVAVGIGREYYSEFYHYINWTNTSDLPIQVEVSPIAQFYEQKLLGFKYGDWFFNSSYDWQLMFLIKEKNNWIFETRENDYFHLPDYDPFVYAELYEDIWETLGNEYDTSTGSKYVAYYTSAYRFRYVDADNLKAGPWVYVVPQGKSNWVSFIEYDDKSSSNASDVTGSSNVYDDLDNIDDVITDIDYENKFKDEYEIVDNEVDVQEASNWLQTVINFIKGTPSVVGSVLGFLPRPILYGMYVCIFLGVIAAGLAIIRALI